jgi:hypothetical protein
MPPNTPIRIEFCDDVVAVGLMTIAMEKGAERDREDATNPLKLALPPNDNAGSELIPVAFTVTLPVSAASANDPPFESRHCVTLEPDRVSVLDSDALPRNSRLVVTGHGQ